MEATLSKLRARFPALQFRAGTSFFWSPETREIVYKSDTSEETATWSLLHEASHALLEHKTYSTDFELLQLEVAAWEQAKAIAGEIGLTIDENHVQDCLDSYRDWIYARSICPRCGTKSLQQSDLHRYRCFNCHENWQVTPSRFCRAYRATKRAESRPLERFDALARI